MCIESPWEKGIMHLNKSILAIFKKMQNLHKMVHCNVFQLSFVYTAEQKRERRSKTKP